jgi:hypothetical protein
MLIADNIYDLAINLVLPDVCFLRIYQDISSPFDPNGIAETRRKLDEYSFLLGQCARVQTIPFRPDDTRNGLGGR